MNKGKFDIVLNEGQLNDFNYLYNIKEVQFMFV